MFIRIKKVKIYYYYYLVESYRNANGKPRLRHIAYLGKSNLKKLPKIKLTECVYCSTKENLTIDHIKPLSKGGTNDIENLQCLCSKCNSSKNNKYCPT